MTLSCGTHFCPVVVRKYKSILVRQRRSGLNQPGTDFSRNPPHVRRTPAPLAPSGVSQASSPSSVLLRCNAGS
jgi:hypothetical protein